MTIRRYRAFAITYFVLSLGLLVVWLFEEYSPTFRQASPAWLINVLSTGALCMIVAFLILLIVHLAFLFIRWQRRENALVRQNIALREQEAQNEAMLTSIGDAVIGTDTDARIVFVNDNCVELLGWTRRELIGKDITEVLPMLDDEGTAVEHDKRPHIKTLRNGRKVSSSMKFAYARKDGSTFPISFTVTPIHVEGQTTGAIEVFRDVTEEKMIDEQKSSYISVAAHQLRSPLTSMRWYLEMVLNDELGKLPKEQKHYLTEVFKSTSRLSELVSDLLNVSRIESGRIAIKPEPTNVIKLMENTIMEARHLLPEGRGRLEFAPPKNGYDSIELDPGMYRQVLHNYLTNAIRYSPSEGNYTVTVTLRTKTITKKNSDVPLNKGKYIVFSVKDEGIGIPPEEKEKLFSKFYRAKNATKMVAEGNGLGLYLVGLIATSSGGGAWFDSTLNHGSTFYFAIPETGMIQKEGDRSFD